MFASYFSLIMSAIDDAVQTVHAASWMHGLKMKPQPVQGGLLGH
jgi:hypothetical protein